MHITYSSVTTHTEVKTEKTISSIFNKVNYSLEEYPEDVIFIKKYAKKFEWNIIVYLSIFSIFFGLLSILWVNFLWLLFLPLGIFMLALEILPIYFEESIMLDFKNDVGITKDIGVPSKSNFIISNITQIQVNKIKDRSDDLSYTLYTRTIYALSGVKKVFQIELSGINEVKINSYCSSITSFLESKIK